MRQAADILSTPAAMQIRTLEVIDHLTQSANTKVILLPTDFSSLNPTYTYPANDKIPILSRDIF